MQKYIEDKNMEIIVGFHAIEEFLKAGHKNCSLYISGKTKRHQLLIELAKTKGIKILKTEQDKIDLISAGQENRGAVVVVKVNKEFDKKLFYEKDDSNFKKEKQQIGRNKKYLSLKEFISSLKESNVNSSSIALILDSITDPHNLGAILRSADQFSADVVIISGRRSAGDSITVRKTSAGAYEYISIVEENLARSIDILKDNGFWVFGADMNGKSCWEQDLKGRVALVLGSEGKGISHLLVGKCDSMVKIPSAGHVDSFNVSVAAGILMYEIFRQQKKT
jgi:23S rRNA (guanosine2251-2'-O)-methyltransferase